MAAGKGGNNRDSAMSGRRKTRQRDEVPSMKDVGSAAYRRLRAKAGQ